MIHRDKRKTKFGEIKEKTEGERTVCGVMVATATSGAGCQDSETNKIHLDYRQIKIIVKVMQYKNEQDTRHRLCVKLSASRVPFVQVRSIWYRPSSPGILEIIAPLM
jgi:hypothetical protein